jgi:hypothetical protein
LKDVHDGVFYRRAGALQLPEAVSYLFGWISQGGIGAKRRWVSSHVAFDIDHLEKWFG